jgi:hypothetical protein
VEHLARRQGERGTALKIGLALLQADRVQVLRVPRPPLAVEDARLEDGQALFQACGFLVAVQRGGARAQLLELFAALLGLRQHHLPAQLALLALHRLELGGNRQPLLRLGRERERVQRHKHQQEQQQPHAALTRAFGSG